MKKTKVEVQKDVQEFIRTLLANPTVAKDFLKQPEDIAKQYGITITAKDIVRIKDALSKQGDSGHVNFPECDHIVISRKPSEKIINPLLKSKK